MITAASSIGSKVFQGDFFASISLTLETRPVDG